MMSFGKEPFLECSSRGDKRFSALYARIKWRGDKTIEELYQAYKLFEGHNFGLSFKDAKGKKPVNIEACRSYYSQLWREFFQENSYLLEDLSEYNGFSDIFGQPNHACQAEEIFRIVMEYRVCQGMRDDT